MIHSQRIIIVNTWKALIWTLLLQNKYLWIWKCFQIIIVWGLWCESMFIFSSMSMMQLYMCAPFVSYNLHLTVLTHLSWIWIKSFITLEKEENMPSSAPQTPRIMKSYLSLSWKNKIKTISWKWIHDFCHTQTAMCEYFLCTYYYIHC